MVNLSKERRTTSYEIEIDKTAKSFLHNRNGCTYCVYIAVAIAFFVETGKQVGIVKFQVVDKLEIDVIIRCDVCGKHVKNATTTKTLLKRRKNNITIV